MKRLHSLTAIITILLFVVPIFVYPVRGGVEDGRAVFTYGFPFSWFSVYFDSQSGRTFFTEALRMSGGQIHIDFITAILNLIILFIAVRAILVVFGRQQQKRRQKASSKQLEKEIPQDDVSPKKDDPKDLPKEP